MFMPVAKQYEYSGYNPVDDSACAGLMLFNVAELAMRWKVGFINMTHKRLQSLMVTRHIQLEMINSGRVQWLPMNFRLSGFMRWLGNIHFCTPRIRVIKY